MELTPEQLAAIERRHGDLFLDAGAGSGKTSVLVERFVRAVLEDGVEVDAILTITFTEKAAAEMRERIRARLRDCGADEAARETEGAFISTIHGFCARVLRAHALRAGVDPAFKVLDRPESQRLAEAAFDDALEELAQNAAGAVELIAAYGPGSLRAASLATYAELRSRGQTHPRLPELGPAPELTEAREKLQRAAARAAGELGAIEEPATRVVQALGRLEQCAAVIAAADPWPGELEPLGLPGGNGAALTTDACHDYAEALARFRAICEHRRAKEVRRLLDELLRTYDLRYEQRKRDCSGLDFEDLELLTRDLLSTEVELRERLRNRFEQIVVDELQDTNQVQLELIESISSQNLFTVGDAQQSIYGFRHADVELFEQRGARLAPEGARATLKTNFRSRREILDVLNRAFEHELGERFTPLEAGRSDPPSGDPRVELLIADKGAEWSPDGLASPWRLAEARALAARVGELLDGGAAAREVVVLTRATTDLRAYERALEDRGIPTYVIGGRGYWSHPQVVDLVSYLRALTNPRDVQALYAVLLSPLVGVSLDALVVLAAASRAADRDPWWVLREPDDRLHELSAQDRERLEQFGSWFERERSDAARRSIEELIERGLNLGDYDLAVLALPGGQRRMANLRKLMRLAREHEASAGRDLRGFLEVVGRRSSMWAPADMHESEAPVEGEALDAVRLMTIHRAKGLEFEIVCVADLGRGPRYGQETVRIGRDGRFGLRLAQPGTGRREAALDYKALGEERLEAQSREERRLFYVAMTRARERLIISGAAKLDGWSETATPMAWVGPALIADLEARVDERRGVADGVAFTMFGPDDVEEAAPPPHGEAAPPAAPGDAAQPAAPTAPPAPPQPLPAPEPPPPISAVSYSALGEYHRCGYRFYAERVLGLPPVVPRGAQDAEAAGGARGAGGLGAVERGILVHTLLEGLDFRRPVVPTEARVIEASERALSAGEAREVMALVAAFADSELCARLGRASGVRREERFRFPLGQLLVVGVLDVIASERGGRTLVVDYKTDRLEGADPRALAASAYATQRLVYALAALGAGAEEVEVVHTFLELPSEPVSATFTQEQEPSLRIQLEALTHGLLERDFAVTDTPHRGVCSGCPAEGGLCSWPLELTRRTAPDRLF